MEHTADAAFWVALGKILWVNLLLSGDNAIVIALAARNLAPAQRRQAMIGGSAAAIVLRIVLTLFAVHLLQLAYLKVVGSLLLFWIAVQLMLPDDHHGESVPSAAQLWPAVRTILVADVVMSLDNVLAVAAAADSGPPQSRLLLLAIGLGLSIPLIIGGSQLLMTLMTRAPVIVTLGAALLGYVAAEMLLDDVAVQPWLGDLGPTAEQVIGLLTAVAVVLVGRTLARRRGGGA